MIENLQRENLHFFEEAEGYLNLIRAHGFTQEELARKLSKNQSTIANKLRILKLPRTVKNRIVSAGLSERHARALLRLHNEEAELRLVDAIAQEGLSVKATEKLVERELRKIYGEVPEEKPKIIRLMNNYRIYVNTIRQAIQKIEKVGVETQMTCEEREDGIEIHIHLAK